MSRRHRFAWIWLIAFAGVMLGTAAFNFLVDPYGLHDVPRWSGFNAVKPRPERSAEDIKLAAALDRRPDAVILGNSRADIGFDPASPAWQGVAKQPFNLGVPGSGLESSIRLLETLVAHGIEPKLVVLGLDPFDFLGSSPAAARPPRDDWTTRAARLRLQSLFTGQALEDSLNTLAAQRDPDAAVILANGFNPMRDYLAIAHNEGYFDMFRQRGLDLFARFSRLNRSADGHGSSADHALERLFALAAEHGIRVEAVVYPFHYEIHGLMEAASLSDAFVDWRLAMAERFSHAAAQGIRVRLVDAAVLNVRTTERIPPRGNTRQEMQWYWDPGHFKKAFGDRLLACILPGDEAALAQCRDESLLAAPPTQASYRESLHDWGRQRPDLTRDVEEIVRTGGRVRG